MAVSDHDLLIRLDEKMDTILKRLDKTDTDMTDHEKRLGRLESFQATTLAFAGAVALVVSIAGRWILAQLKVG